MVRLRLRGFWTMAYLTIIRTYSCSADGRDISVCTDADERTRVLHMRTRRFAIMCTARNLDDPWQWEQHVPSVSHPIIFNTDLHNDSPPKASSHVARGTLPRSVYDRYVHLDHADAEGSSICITYNAHASMNDLCQHVYDAVDRRSAFSN